MVGQRQKNPELLVRKRGGRGRGLVVQARDGAFIAPTPPPGLRAAGIAAWGQFWRSKVSAAVDLDADRVELDHWVRCVDERERLWDVVEKMPLVRGSHGQLMANPLSRRIRDLTQDIDRISDRFGMNPMARWRLQFTVSEASKSAVDLVKLLTDWNDGEADLIDRDNL